MSKVDRLWIAAGVAFILLGGALFEPGGPKWFFGMAVGSAVWFFATVFVFFIVGGDRR